MTTIDLLQRYPSQRDGVQPAKVSHANISFDSNHPDLTVPDLNPSQYFDAKTKLLHDMLDRVVKDLASNQPEPASEWDGTLWRSPLLPRSRSPTYSEISDSFESPSRIEHCTNDLLSTPISPTSTQLRGPDGWPLGIEVAMNDFHRGRLSTAVLQEKELPNRLTLRKKQQQTPILGGNRNREGQESVDCRSARVEEQRDSQIHQEGLILKPLAFQKPLSSVLFQRCGERQEHIDSASLQPLPSQQRSFTRPYQHSDFPYRRECVDLQLPELQQQSDGETGADILCVPNLSARRYDASTDLYPALTNDNVPIGLNLENASLKPSIFQPCSEGHDTSHPRTNDICLLHNNSRQIALSDSLPPNKQIHGDAHQAELRICALANALDEQPDSFKKLGVADKIVVQSTDRETGCHNTFENSGEYTSEAVWPLTSEDSKSNIDSDVVSCKTSCLLEDILEETEDLLPSTLTLGPALDRGQPQHFSLEAAQHLDLQKLHWAASERRDSKLAFQGAQTGSSTLLSSPSLGRPRTSRLTINTYSKMQFEAIRPLDHGPIDVKSSESFLPAAKMAKLRNADGKEGRLTAAALAELRKTAESQPHFQTGPDSPGDRSQAEIHPLLRSKSFARASLQPSKVSYDSALKYVFKDDDTKGHEVEEGDSISHQITTKPCSLIEPKAQDAGNFVTHTSMTEHTLSQPDMMTENTIPRYPSEEDPAEDQVAEHAGTFTPQKSNLESFNDITLVPSLENVPPLSSFLPSTLPLAMNRPSASAVRSPDMTPSSIFQPSVSPAAKGYYPNSAFPSPTAYNSWASTPHHHEHGNSCSTPSSGATLPTSTVPTSSTTLCSNSPTSCGMTMTPVLSFGKSAGNVPTSRGTKMTPSSSYGQFAGHSPNFRGMPMTPSSSLGDFTDNKFYRRSVSFSSMFARYHKARYPDLPTAAQTDSILSSKESAEWDQAGEVTNDPFTSIHDSSTSFSLNIKAPSKEDLADSVTLGIDKFNTPTKRSSGRFSVHRRSLSSSRRPNTNEGIERALSTLIFNPRGSRAQERSHSTSAPIDTTAKPDGRGHRRSFSIATNNVSQKWEIAPPPTPLCLRDEFSMRYRPEPLKIDDHYAMQKDALQGMKQGLKKVFGRK